MPTIGLFRKPRKEDDEKTSMSPSEDKQDSGKTYLKAMPLRDLSDIEAIKNEVNNGNILILRKVNLKAECANTGKNSAMLQFIYHQLFRCSVGIYHADKHHWWP